MLEIRKGLLHSSASFFDTGEVDKRSTCNVYTIWNAESVSLGYEQAARNVESNAAKRIVLMLE